MDIHNRNIVWTTRTGDKIKLKDITDSHLDNLYRHVLRELNVASSYASFNPDGYDFYNYWEQLLDKEIDYRKNVRDKPDEVALRYILGKMGW